MSEVDGIALRGLILHFNTQISGQHNNANAENYALHPEISFTRYQPDNVVWNQIEDENSFGCCYGELLSYRSDGDTLTCLKQILSDWAADRLDHQKINGRFVLLFCGFSRHLLF